MKAAVDEATRWGTYVMVHALVDEAVVQSLDAGVKSIDHGAEISEKTLKRMAKEGAWLVPTANCWPCQGSATLIRKVHWVLLSPVLMPIC